MHITAWGKSYSYLGSEGVIYATMGGKVQIKSSCSLTISTDHNGDSWETYYSHMRIDDDIQDGQYVDQGQRIGKIETNSHAASCNIDCDKRKDQFEIASGPHLHMELFKNQRRETLNDKEFSGFIIKAGIYNMDLNGVDLENHCTDATDCTKAVLIEDTNKYCATRFIDKHNSSNVFCPSIIGANNGMPYGPLRQHLIKNEFE